MQTYKSGTISKVSLWHLLCCTLNWKKRECFLYKIILRLCTLKTLAVLRNLYVKVSRTDSMHGTRTVIWEGSRELTCDWLTNSLFKLVRVNIPDEGGWTVVAKPSAIWNINIWKYIHTNIFTQLPISPHSLDTTNWATLCLTTKPQPICKYLILALIKNSTQI